MAKATAKTTTATAQKKQQATLQQAGTKSSLTQAYQADRKKQPDIAPTAETGSSSAKAISGTQAKQPGLPSATGGTTQLASYLQGVLQPYQAKTSDEIRKRAESEIGSQYDSRRLALQQQYDASDLALKQQAAGLGKTYDKQREASAEQYAKSRSQTDRAMLSRGMQRSSYGMQTLANIDKAGAKAQQEIYDAQAAAEADIGERRTQLATQLAQGMNQLNDSQLADTAKRIGELEDQDWQRGQAASQQAISTALSLYGLGQTDAAQAQAAKQFEQSLGLQQQQLGLQQQSLEHQIGQDLWSRQFQEAGQKQSAEQFQQSFGLQQQSLQHQIDQDQWGREFSQKQLDQSASQFSQSLGLQQQSLQHSIDQDMWKRGFDERQAEQSASQFAQSLGLQQQQLDQSAGQFAQSLSLQQQSLDASTSQEDRKYAWTVVQGMLSSGQMPSGELLKMAGISDADAQKLLKKQSSAPKKTTTTTDTGSTGGATQPASDTGLISSIDSFGQQTTTPTVGTPSKPVGAPVRPQLPSKKDTLLFSLK